MPTTSKATTAIPSRTTQTLAELRSAAIAVNFSLGKRRPSHSRGQDFRRYIQSPGPTQQSSRYAAGTIEIEATVVTLESRGPGYRPWPPAGCAGPVDQKSLRTAR
jgi:hypothetical protein